MAQPTDTSAIQRLIRGRDVRIRTQWALEGATTATVIAAAARRSRRSSRCARSWSSPTTGIYLLIASGLLDRGRARCIGATRQLDDELVARRIDRASNLSDRLSTAIAFERVARERRARADDDADARDDDRGDQGRRAAPRRARTSAPRRRSPRRATGAPRSASSRSRRSPPASRFRRPITRRTSCARIPITRRPATHVDDRGHEPDATASRRRSRRCRSRTTMGAPGHRGVRARPFVPTARERLPRHRSRSRGPVAIVDWTATTIMIVRSRTTRRSARRS